MGAEEEISEEEQLEMLQEEEDETGLDVSPSGMADDLTCGDEKVAAVLLELNEARESRLTCSDRSTGAAANWAYLVAEEYGSSLLSARLFVLRSDLVLSWRCISVWR